MCRVALFIWVIALIGCASSHSETLTQEGVFYERLTGRVLGAGYASGVEPGALIEEALELPSDAVLTEVRMLVAPGPHSRLPQMSPAISVVRIPSDGTAYAMLVGYQTDAAASAEEYNRPHDIVVGDLSERVDRASFHYGVLFQQESGGDAVAGEVRDARVTVLGGEE